MLNNSKSICFGLLREIMNDYVGYLCRITILSVLIEMRGFFEMLKIILKRL